jgi:hypothetical protein
MTLSADRDRRNAMVGAGAFMMAHGLIAAPAWGQAKAKPLWAVPISTSPRRLPYEQ